MNINVFEMINVLVVIGLFSLLAHKRDAITALVVLFVYGTLHFSFAAVALATNESANLLIALHNEGGGLLAKLSTLSLLSVVFALLGRAAYKVYRSSQPRDKRIVHSILLAMAILACGYALNIRQGDWLQFKNFASLEAMFVLILIGFLGTSGAQSRVLYPAILTGLVILGITDCVALYEVFDRSSWAATLESSGAMVYRASSLLFNPNLFAFWASLVYLACAYGMHACEAHRKMMLWGMVLASIAIYFSGSRSAGYLLLGALIIPALLIRERLRWAALMIFPLSMSAIYAASAWLVPPFDSDSEGWHEIALLGERFAATPLYLVSYASKLMGMPVEHMAAVPSEVVQSIEGRFIGEGRDAGWLVLYQDVGVLGTSAMLLLSTLAIWVAVKTGLEKRSAASVYALATLSFCLLTGLVMRLQIFPVWLFIGLFLIPCLEVWLRDAANNPNEDGKSCVL